MINIQKLIEEANENGYQGDKASAKVCQDIVLKALSVGPLSRNVTIMGGYVEILEFTHFARVFKFIGQSNFALITFLKHQKRRTSE